MGNIEKAVQTCMDLNRFADALVLAVCLMAIPSVLASLTDFAAEYPFAGAMGQNQERIPGKTSCS